MSLRNGVQPLQNIRRFIHELLPRGPSICIALHLDIVRFEYDLCHHTLRKLGVFEIAVLGVGGWIHDELFAFGQPLGMEG